MAAIIQGLRGAVSGFKAAYEKEVKSPSSFENLTTEKKLEQIAGEVAIADREFWAMKNLLWTVIALYYAGHQNIEKNGNNLDIYEDPDYYVENKFRPQVDAVVGMLNRLEPPFSCGPGGDSPEDIAASRTADSAMTLMLDNVAYDTLKHQKNLYKALFGTAFVFTDYIVDKKYGMIVEPTYEHQEMPGIPNEDGTPGAPVMSKVHTGFTSRPKGQEIAIAVSPRAIRCKPDVQGGIDNQPYMQWRSRHDVDTLKFIYKGLKVEPASSRTEDIDLYPEANVRSNDENKAELLRTWLQPCMFKGDPKLEKEFPDGVHVATVNGKYVDHYAENLRDRWTYEVLIPMPESFHGDGLVDALGPQDQKNITNSLVLKHIDFTTTGKTVILDGTIDPKEWANDPENHIVIARNVPMDKGLDAIIKQLPPGQLSQDVGAWLQHVDSAMQTMTSAEDPLLGKSIGANTPYSQSVFLSERAQARWAGSQQYNKPEQMRFYQQLLEIAQNHWIDERTRSIKDNTGQWSFEKFSQANLRGNVDIILGNADQKPKTRAEKVQALDALVQLQPVLQTCSPKQKLWIEEILGMPADSNALNSQIARAMRNIDRIKKGETVTPLPMVDDPVAQVPAYKEFLVSEKGEALAMENPEVYANVYAAMVALMQLQLSAMGNPAAMAAHGIAHGAGPNDPNQPPQAGSAPKPNNGTPGGQPGQKGGGPGSLQQPEAQSPAPAPPVQAPAPV